MTSAMGRRSLEHCGDSVSPCRDGPPEGCSPPLGEALNNDECHGQPHDLVVG